MATVEYLHVCDYAFLTDDKPGFVGIFTRITSPVFPYKHPHFAIGIEFIGTVDENFPLQITLARVNGPEIAQATGTAKIGLFGGVFVGMHFVGVLFPQADNYRVTVLSNGQQLAQSTFQVLQGPGR